MKLYNRSRVPDHILLPMLREAAVAAGCGHHGKIVVKVNIGRYQTSGHAGIKTTATWVRKAGKTRRVECDGRITIALYQPKPGERVACQNTPDKLALDHFLTAVHEFKHVIDERHDLRFDSRGASSRRRNWHKRPEEKRAVALTDKVRANIKPGTSQSKAIRQYTHALECVRTGTPILVPDPMPVLEAAQPPDPLAGTRKRLVRAERELEKIEGAERRLATRRTHWNRVAAGCRNALR